MRGVPYEHRRNWQAVTLVLRRHKTAGCLGVSDDQRIKRLARVALTLGARESDNCFGDGGRQMDELSEFDAPIFKQLSHNDSGGSVGHQAGVVIPQSLDPYFPQMAGLITKANPSISETIRAILVVGNKEVDDVETSYQYQSWKAGRKIERRITGNLGRMRSKSAEHDILLIERNLTDRSLYRLTLLKEGTDAFKSVLKSSGGKRWGAVSPLNPPTSEPEIENAEEEQKKHEAKPLKLFDNDAAVTESRTRKIARSRAFQKLTTQYYDGKCALCGKGLKAKNDKTETEAAHIVPRGRFGADDARNGLALCRSHHWAFDKGMWGVKPDGKVVVVAAVIGKAENTSLKDFNGKKLRPPSVAAMMPSSEALAWHLDKIVKFTSA